MLSMLHQNFTEPLMESEFRREKDRTWMLQSRVAIFLGALVYGAFILLDRTVAPTSSFAPVAVRLVCVLLLFVCLGLTYAFPRQIEYSAIAALSIAQTGHMALMLLSPMTWMYGTSMTLVVMIFMFSFTRLLHSHSMILASSFLVLWFVEMFWLGASSLDLLNSFYFLFSVAAAGVIGGFAMERYFRQDYLKSRLLRESERRLSDIIDFMPDAVFVIDAEGKVVAWNRATERLTGVAANSLLGKGNHEYSIPFYGERRPILIDLVARSQEELEKGYAAIHREGDVLSGETYLPLGGKGAYLLGRAAQLFDANGGAIGAIETLEDLTERKAAEEALRAARDQAEQSRREFEKLNEFSREVAANENLDEIIDSIFDHIHASFGLDYMALYLVDRERQELFGYRDKSPPEAAAFMPFFYKQRLPLTARTGGVALAYRRKRPFYMPTFDGIDLTQEDQDLLRHLNLKSLLAVPLLLRGELIGVVNISRCGTPMHLTEMQVKSITVFCQQIAGAIHNARLLKDAREARSLAEAESKKSQNLLYNILPVEIADELRRSGPPEPVLYESATVMFTDFEGFTKIAETLTPKALVTELDQCFSYFDSLMDRYHLEKLKTIGDSYMCAGGIPVRNQTHPVDMVLAALEIQAFMSQVKWIRESQGLPYWELRVGIHTGPLVAGVIGAKKFAYDVWSDTVNIASRMESSGVVGKINISGSLHQLIRDFFECDYRGMIPAKGKGEIEMYFVHGVRRKLTMNGDGRTPNDEFQRLYTSLTSAR